MWPAALESETTWRERYRETHSSGFAAPPAGVALAQSMDDDVDRIGDEGEDEERRSPAEDDLLRRAEILPPLLLLGLILVGSPGQGLPSRARDGWFDGLLGGFRRADAVDGEHRDEEDQQNPRIAEVDAIQDDHRDSVVDLHDGARARVQAFTCHYKIMHKYVFFGGRKQSRRSDWFLLPGSSYPQQTLVMDRDRELTMARSLGDGLRISMLRIG